MLSFAILRTIAEQLGFAFEIFDPVDKSFSVSFRYLYKASTSSSNSQEAPYGATTRRSPKDSRKSKSASPDR